MRIDAVVLAAGRGSRMGRPKHLLPIEGIPMLDRVVSALSRSGVRESLVVVAQGDEEGRQRAASLGTRPVLAEDPHEGRAASVRAGVRALRADCEGVMFALADQPFLLPGDFGALVARFERADAGLVFATYAGRRGTPVLFSTSYRDELLALRGREGGRVVLARHAADAADVPLPPERGRDVNRPEDLVQAR